MDSVNTFLKRMRTLYRDYREGQRPVRYFLSRDVSVQGQARTRYAELENGQIVRRGHPGDGE